MITYHKESGRKNYISLPFRAIRGIGGGMGGIDVFFFPKGGREGAGRATVVVQHRVATAVEH